MDDRFFKEPILNSPYACPGRHWDLDESGQPTGEVVDGRRKASFVTPIPRAKKQKKSAQVNSSSMRAKGSRPKSNSTIFCRGGSSLDRSQRYPLPVATSHPGTASVP